jgi:hypothetical protein
MSRRLAMTFTPIVGPRVQYQARCRECEYVSISHTKESAIEFARGHAVTSVHVVDVVFSEDSASAEDTTLRVDSFT